MYHSGWRALLAFSIGDEDVKCTAQFHTSPTQNTNNTLFENADLELKISPPEELKTKTGFKKMVASVNTAGVGEKRDGKLFIFVISPSIILVFLSCLYYFD